MRKGTFMIGSLFAAMVAGACADNASVGKGQSDLTFSSDSLPDLLTEPALPDLSVEPAKPLPPVQVAPCEEGTMLVLQGTKVFGPAEEVYPESLHLAANNDNLVFAWKGVAAGYWLQPIDYRAMPLGSPAPLDYVGIALHDIVGTPDGFLVAGSDSKRGVEGAPDGWGIFLARYNSLGAIKMGAIHFVDPSAFVGRAALVSTKNGEFFGVGGQKGHLGNTPPVEAMGGVNTLAQPTNVFEAQSLSRTCNWVGDVIEHSGEIAFGVVGARFVAPFDSELALFVKGANGSTREVQIVFHPDRNLGQAGGGCPSFFRVHSVFLDGNNYGVIWADWRGGNTVNWPLNVSYVEPQDTNPADITTFTFPSGTYRAVPRQGGFVGYVRNLARVPAEYVAYFDQMGVEIPNTSIGVRGTSKTPDWWRPPHTLIRTKCGVALGRLLDGSSEAEAQIFCCEPAMP